MTGARSMVLDRKQLHFKSRYTIFTIQKTADDKNKMINKIYCYKIMILNT
jgi:hypothetical protein